MEDWTFWEGQNLFIVIFLLILVVALSCGLLGFICMKILEDRLDGVHPSLLFSPRRMANNELMSNAPTKIIVTSPPTDETRSQTSAAGVKDANGLHDQVSVINVQSKRSNYANRVGPTEKVIYSTENSPVTSPNHHKVFVWSKSNSFDYGHEGPSDDREQGKRRNSFNFPHASNTPLSLFHSCKATSPSPKHKRSGDTPRDSRRNSVNVPQTPNSPLSLFHNFKATAHSPPANPTPLIRRNSVFSF